MKNIGLAIFGWLVPGGAFLLTRRYAQFAGFALLVSITYATGLTLHGGSRWPTPLELQGLDGFTALVFQGGGLANLLTGGPYLVAQVLGLTTSFLDGRLHEYGTTLVILAGVFNVLAISNALELRKTEGR